LQLGVLIETMRREGFELSVSRAARAVQDRRRRQKLEPIEEVVIDVDDAYTGVVVEKSRCAKARCRKCARPAAARPASPSTCAPSRGLIGYHGEFLTDTRGTGVMNRLFHATRRIRARSKAAATAC
jgi:GTP-binding protein